MFLSLRSVKVIFSSIILLSLDIKKISPFFKEILAVKPVTLFYQKSQVCQHLLDNVLLKIFSVAITGLTASMILIIASNENKASGLPRFYFPHSALFALKSLREIIKVDLHFKVNFCYNGVMEKNCKILFADHTTYDFALQNLPIALHTIHDRGWKVVAIHTPYGVLTLLDEEEYKKIISAFADDE